MHEVHSVLWTLHMSLCVYFLLLDYERTAYEQDSLLLL